MWISTNRKCIVCGEIYPTSWGFLKRGKTGHERICYKCRDTATREDWKVARQLTHKIYEGKR